MSSRHRARRLALQGLCCLDAQGEKAAELVHDFIADSNEQAQVLQTAHELVRNAFADRAACDALLARHARHWELGRLALVDRNILRLGTYELRASRAPEKVVITEAIRLAREFSTAESPRFINGVLDAVAKEISRDQGDKTSRDTGDTNLDSDKEEKEEQDTEEA